jgi:hypothetical protein
LRTDNQNIQRAQKINSPKINGPVKKWATELNRTFSKEVQIAKKKKKKNMKEILTIPGHKGNANQNHTKIHFTPVRIDTIKNTTNKCLQGCRVRGKEPSNTAGGNVASSTTTENIMETS